MSPRQWTRGRSFRSGPGAPMAADAAARPSARRITAATSAHGRKGSCLQNHRRRGGKKIAIRQRRKAEMASPE